MQDYKVYDANSIFPLGSTPKGHPPLKFYQFIIWRWIATLSAYLMLSLAYSFVSMAFQINFTHTNPITSQTQATNMDYGNPVSYGHGTFLVYWMLNFFGMIALGIACENVAMVVGAPWVGLWLIFWVITNVCKYPHSATHLSSPPRPLEDFANQSPRSLATSFYDIEIAPAFYRWGYAWPLHSSMLHVHPHMICCHAPNSFANDISQLSKLVDQYCSTCTLASV
jgi:hypothetical protein